ncbi:hypothetical protein HYE29_00775 [Mycoplasmopsis bovis]|nr:hypothetical protein [Mycoplasmopsis bovis]QQH22681.1 hypothetical protein HYE29_00775 [Mycoplasmopsis bovis]
MWFLEEEKTKIAEYIKLKFKELINNKDVEQLKKKIDELNDCIQYELKVLQASAN